MPPPTPVPTATNTAVSQPRAAPSSDSASAKARASLISAVGASSASARRGTTGTPGQPPGMFVRKVVVAARASKRPGTPMPTVSTAPASRPAATSLPITPSGPSAARVSSRAVGRDLVVLEDDPLDVRRAEIEPEVPHRTAQPPSTVSTVPVTNGAVAR